MSLLAVVLTITTWAQSFEGKVAASMKAIALPEEMAGMEDMFNQSMTSHYKGAKTHLEVINTLGMTTVIVDTIKKEVIMLTNVMGQKIAIKEPLTKENSNTPMFGNLEDGKLEFKNETKVIAGYTCKKAIYTMTSDKKKNENQVVEFWYNDELGIHEEGSPVKGIVMEYTMTVEGITFQYTVTEITKEKVDDTKFTIPAGYTVKTREEFEKSFPKMD